ncbi:MAG: DUF3833 family protein [Pseudomonadota bacterium]|nr:DUF3833 family protein [Pseudomonadota bacterium]
MSWVIGALFGLVFFLILAVLRDRFLSFRGQVPDDYSDDATDFDLKTCLNGPMLCEGIIYGPTGRVVSRFVAKFDIEWTGNHGVMRESFRYDSGETQDRVWELDLKEDGSFSAKADDVEGGGRGTVCGGAVQLAYRLRLPKDAGGYLLNVTDWMYLTHNGTIMNRSQFRKFGVKVAELVATIRKEPAT